MDPVARAALSSWSWRPEVIIPLLILGTLFLVGWRRLRARSGRVTGWRTLGEFDLPSAPGNERLAIEQVMQLVADAPLAPRQSDRLKTAVGEATMNAMEHGNRYQADLPVHITVLANDDLLQVRIVDHGGDRAVPTPEQQKGCICRSR